MFESGARFGGGKKSDVELLVPCNCLMLLRDESCIAERWLARLGLALGSTNGCTAAIRWSRPLRGGNYGLSSGTPSREIATG